MIPISAADREFASEESDSAGEAPGALTQLRAFLAQARLPQNARLPPERELAEVLGVSRGDLRKALAALERRGELWRQVGKGTFLGARPAARRDSVADIAALTSPSEVMRARLLLEPELAREAALCANAEDIGEMRLCLAGARDAGTWRQYEHWDNRLHRAIAQASHNALLVAIFDTLNAVRRTVVWGRLRDSDPQPPADHHSFAEHDAIVGAIAERNLAAAAGLMRQHLRHVEALLLARAEAAE